MIKILLFFSELSPLKGSFLNGASLKYQFILRVCLLSFLSFLVARSPSGSFAQEPSKASTSHELEWIERPMDKGGNNPTPNSSIDQVDQDRQKPKGLKESQAKKKTSQSSKKHITQLKSIQKELHSKNVPLELDQKDKPPGYGWTLQLYTGLNSCIPSGKASCAHYYPGVLAGGDLGYRWTYVRLGIESDWSYLWVSDAGESNLSSSSQTLLLSLYGYYPYQNMDLFFGGGLGYGTFDLKDQVSTYGVSWSSLWQNVRLAVGAQKALNSFLAVEMRLVLDLHLGGQRCVTSNGIDVCLNREELPSTQQDVSSLMHFMLGLRY